MPVDFRKNCPCKTSDRWRIFEDYISIFTRTGKEKGILSIFINFCKIQYNKCNRKYHSILAEALNARILNISEDEFIDPHSELTPNYNGQSLRNVYVLKKLKS